jgi:very-short-patch-repair endonuclease
MRLVVSDLRSMRLYNLNYLKAFRKELRNRSTSAEIHLWSFLKRRQVSGLKFRRQYSVGPYILDFYCVEIRLAIELDGEVHNDVEQRMHDKHKDAFMASAGIVVWRVENRAVYDSADTLLNEIERYAEQCRTAENKKHL